MPIQDRETDMHGNILKITRTIIFAALVLGFTSISCDKGGGTGSSGPEGGAVTGHVFLEGSLKPINDVVVTCGGIADTTQKSGHYQLLNIPPGSQTITAENTYYRAYSSTVMVKTNETAILDIFMQYDQSAK